MDDNALITLGSLFDGIGAMPYAASFFGIKTLWASEILPNAISVTKRHFPGMEHLGDVTKLDGGKIAPVSIIAFGSPCQSWSVASGARKGLDGKSGLFMEAIRIIREMRCATNETKPEIVLFENVVGLLNCRAGGRDNYKAVLEAFTEAEIPMPESGRWATAGMVRGNGVDLAWIVKDASQHFRTPQRRRRLFLVLDFTERRCAGEILFISKSLSGYFASRESAGKGFAADTESGVRNAGAGVSAFMAGQAKNALNTPHNEIFPSCLMRIREGKPGGGKGPLIQVERSGTLATGNDQYLFCTPCRQSGMPHSVLTETDYDNPFPSYCLQGNMIGRKDENGPQGNGINTEVSFSLTSVDKHAVCAVDCRNLNERTTSGTLQSKCTGGYSLNYQNPLRVGYAVRRLTPLEAERLMSLPDGYTEYGHDGKLMSDSARLSMCGNSIVVNVLAYIMQNIAEILKSEKPRE